MNNLLTCPHCNQDTIRQVGQSIDCTNPTCDGYTITLPAEQFMALTQADFAKYKTGTHLRVQMNVDQAEFEARMAQLEIDLAARAEARKSTDRVFG